MTIPTADPLRRVPPFGPLRRVPPFGPLRRVPPFGLLRRVPPFGLLRRVPPFGPLRRVPPFGLTLLLLACGPEAPAAGGAGALDEAEAIELSEPINAAGLAISLPAAWTRVEPRSSMRLLEAQLPGSGGQGEISMYYFGPGGGGGPAANIERWKSQVVPEGSAPAPITQSRESDGVRRTWIELPGMVKASTIGSFPTTDQPNFALYGAVIEAPGGPWFLRAVGPAATMQEQRQAFLAMLESARPRG